MVVGTGVLLAAPAFADTIAASPRTYAVDCDTAAPVLFGVGRLTEALQQQGFVADVDGALKVRAKIAPSPDLGNEDFFLLRWCGPSFVREHIRLNSQPWTGGYYVGSECYIPAANFFDKPDLPGRARWAFQRQRLFYVVWGRHLYDPNLDDAALTRAIDRQYGQGTGTTLLPVLDMASRTPLRQKCLQHWDQVVASTRDRYSETPLLHTGTIPFSWARYRAAVAADIATAKRNGASGISHNTRQNT